MCKQFNMAAFIVLSFLAIFALTDASCVNKNYRQSQHTDCLSTRAEFPNMVSSSDSTQNINGVSWTLQNSNQATQNQRVQSTQPNENAYLGQRFDQNNQPQISGQNSPQNLGQMGNVPSYNAGGYSQNTNYGQYPSNGNAGVAVQQYDRTKGNGRPNLQSTLQTQNEHESPSGYRGQSALSQNPVSNQGGSVHPIAQGPYDLQYKLSEESRPSSQSFGSQPTSSGSLSGQDANYNPNDKPVAPQDQYPLMDYSDYNNFAWSLFKNADNDYGAIVSPAILAYQLVLFKEYSRGLTRGELERALGNTKREQIRRMIYETQALPTTKLELANGIFYESSLHLNPNLKNADEGFTHVQRFYTSHRMDAIASVNKWTKNVTHGEIPELLDPSFQIERVKMILASAMYFKGSWKHRFNTSAEGGSFENYRNEQRNVPFMEIKNNIVIGRVNYKVGPKTINIQVVQLPYDDETHAMLLIMPTDRQNRISDVREHFTGEEFLEIVESISQNAAQRVTLKMPKFSINSEISAVAALQHMGITKLFTEGADLLIADTPQRVGDIIQRSVLRVDEIGTTAASVAASFLIPLSADSVVNREIIINRPFLSIIYNTKTNAALFISHVTNV